MGAPPGVFACGDIATSLRDPRPKAGVFAVRQGPVVADNLRRFLTGRTLRTFRPQTEFLSLISTGDRNAVATKYGLALQARWLWAWKDRIDRAFMRSFGDDLPAMPGPREGAPVTLLPSGHTLTPTSCPLLRADRSPEAVQHAGAEARAAWAATAMRCGGCAAKISAPVLVRVLARLPSPPAPHVIAGMAAADDAAVLRPPPPGTVLVQTTDFFRAFTSDPYVFGRIAANHALGDCFAMGATPAAALATAVVPFAVDAVMVCAAARAAGAPACALNAPLPRRRTLCFSSWPARKRCWGPQGAR